MMEVEMPQDVFPADGDPAATLTRMIRGFWISRTISAAASLNLADHVGEEPVSCAELAESVDLPERSLFRLMRALSSVGVFEEASPRAFRATPLSSLLRTDVPGSLRSTAVFMGEVLYPAWGSLLSSVRSEQPSFADTFGTNFFAYQAAHPELGRAFQEMMAGLNRATNAAVPRAYDFSGIDSLVDVGGGNGSQLAAILQANPEMRGVLFDLPHVLESARQHLAAAGVIERCELVGGDFFDGVPEGADAYLLRWVLHDYDDERSVTILQRCRSAMGPSGRLLVIEQVMPAFGETPPWISAFIDVQMLLLLGGQERTEEEFRVLFQSSDFHLRRTISTDSPHSIIEGVPA
jgi:ubiquinone/menaquinone biosynthesis C-methylase UbiE